MFCRRSVGIHLLRGCAGAALLLAALLVDDAPAVMRLAAGVGAFVLFRGCPTCWLVGLFETRAQAVAPTAGRRSSERKLP